MIKIEKNFDVWVKFTSLFRINTILPILTALMMCGILFSAPISFAQNNDISELPKIIAGLEHSDPRIVIDNLKKLSAYPYKEAEAAAIGVLNKQISKGPDFLNLLVVEAALTTLEDIGTQSQSDKVLEQLQTVVAFKETSRFTSGVKEGLAKRFELTIVSMFEKAGPLPAGIQLRLTNETKLKTIEGVRLMEIDGVYYAFMEDVINKRAAHGDEASKVIKKVAIEYLTDAVLQQVADQNIEKIVGRDQEAKDALLTLVRMKGQNPIFVGPAGVGKTTITQRLAQILINELPANDLYNELRGATVISTSPARISRLATFPTASEQAAAIETFFDAVIKLETQIKHPIIVYIDEIHTLSEAQIEAMKPYLDSKTRGIKLIGSSTGREFNMAFKHNEAMKRRLQLIDVKEFSVEQTVEIIRRTWEIQIAQRYNVRFTAEAIKNIVANAQTLMPDNGRFDGAIKIMQDIAIAETEKNQGHEAVKIADAQVNTFLQRRLGYPVNPKDGRAMQTYRQELTQQLESDVLFQKSMIDSTVDLWMDLMGDSDRGVRVQMLLGPTGTGKSELGRSLAKRVFNREGAFLEIDANTYKSKESLNSLLGAPNGYISSNKTSGILIDYLDDPSKGKFGGVILINEAERMSPDAWERLMEMLDVGQIAGGDGKTRNLKRHLILLTSNRVDKLVYPAGIDRLTDAEMDKHIAKYDNAKLRSTYTQKSSGTDQFLLPDPVVARVDRWALAKPITLAMAKVMAVRIAEKTAEKLGERYSVKVTITPQAAEAMAERSFQYGMGARPVIRATQGWLQKIITDAVANANPNSKTSIAITIEKDVLKAHITGGKSATLDLPKGKSLDPLDDPAFQQKMKNLLPTLNAKIIGQDEATKSLARAVIAHQSDPGVSTRPAALFMVGSTGAGKTQMAKALAAALFNSEDRAEVIDLSKVSAEGGLNDVFGSKKGFVGSTDRSLFEEILLRNPEGGVIVFDEASNMGGENKALKNSLFKQGFYSMLEEGKWISSATGTTYDLSKFVILFTGNDGEKLFQGVDADDLRLAEYKRNKDRSKVQKLLLEAGVPEAFLGRMIDVILMKPLLSVEIQKITENMLKEVLKPYSDRGIRIEVDPQFTAQVAKAFFSHDQGARSIRNMLHSGFKATLANIIIEAGGAQEMKHGQTIRVRLTDNLPQKPYKLQATPKRKVELVLELLNDKGQLANSVATDLSTSATKINKQLFGDARATAIHEAGHAIANDPSITGQRLDYLTIVGANNYLGYARYDETPPKSGSFTRETLIARVTTLLAGSRAQQIDGQPIDAGMSSDLKQARELISRAIMDFGLIPEVHGVLMRDGKPHLTSQQAVKVAKYIDEVMKESDARAEQILRSHWQLVRDVAAKLLKQGNMSGDEFYKMAGGMNRMGKLSCSALFL